MVNCAIYNCKSNNKKNTKNTEQVPVKFFRFPQNPLYSKIWEQKCGRSDTFLVKNSRICSKHFLPEHYVKNLRHQLLNYSPNNSKKLNDDAIPTENLPNQMCKTTKNEESVVQRQKRIEKRNYKQIATEIL